MLFPLHTPKTQPNKSLLTPPQNTHSHHHTNIWTTHHVHLLLLLLLTTFTSQNISYSHFQKLKVKQIFTKTKLNPTHTSKHPQYQKLNTTTEASSSSTKYKLMLVHRDKVPTFNTSHNHWTRFNAQMQWDPKRVIATKKPTYVVEAFESDVVFDME